MSFGEKKRDWWHVFKPYHCQFVKGDPGLAKNYRGIILTSIAAKIYNALQRNRIENKIDNILRKNQNGFRRNRSTTSQILTIRRILEGIRKKKNKSPESTLIVMSFGGRNGIGDTNSNPTHVNLSFPLRYYPSEKRVSVYPPTNYW